jgi:hypothetical protein
VHAWILRIRITLAYCLEAMQTKQIGQICNRAGTNQTNIYIYIERERYIYKALTKLLATYQATLS